MQRVTLLLFLVLAGNLSSALPQQQRHPKAGGFVFPNDPIFFDGDEEGVTTRVEREHSSEEDDGAPVFERRLGGEDESEEAKKESLIAEESFCADEDEFCENPTNYPESAVRRLLARIGSSNKGAFFFESTPPPSEQEQQPRPQHESRPPRPQPRPQQEFTPRLPVPQGKGTEASVVTLKKKPGSPTEPSSKKQPASGNAEPEFDINGRINLLAGAEADESDAGQEDKRPGFPSSTSVHPQGVTTTTPTPSVDFDFSSVDAFAPASSNVPSSDNNNNNAPEMFLQETPLCPTISRYVYPKRGLTRDETQKFIINSPETEFIQAVRVETCLNAGSQCSLSDFDLSSFGIRTVCRQKYTYRKLLAINANGSDEFDYFKFPTACSCFQIEETPFNVGSRPFTDASSISDPKHHSESVHGRGGFSAPLTDAASESSPRTLLKRNNNK